MRRHDKDKARYLVESPIVSQCTSEGEDAQKSPAPLGPVLAEEDELVFVNDIPAGDLSSFRPVTNRSQKITLMVRCPASDCAPENHGLLPIWVNGRCKQARRIQTVIGRMLRGETLAVIDRACIQRIQTCPHFGAEGFEQWCKRQFPDITQPLRQWGLSRWAVINVTLRAFLALRVIGMHGKSCQEEVVNKMESSQTKLKISQNLNWEFDSGAIF